MATTTQPVAGKVGGPVGSDDPIASTGSSTINTSQPNPATTQVQAGSAAVAAPQTPPAPTATSAAPTGINYPGASFTPNDAGKQALAQAQASGPPPQTKAEANPIVQDALKSNPPPPDTTLAVNALAQDPGYQKLVADAKKASDVTAQQATLLDQYKQMETDAGLPGINTDLLNTQKIIQGTEDDIRSEVQAANGFATNSQVMALADARNKTLITNYNNLLAQQKQAEDHINTMIQLAGTDRQNAIAAVNQQLNIDSQMADYTQKFNQNAQEGFKNVVSAVGYSGLVNSLLNSDPTGKTLTQAEATLGMQPGQLKQIATQEKSAQNLQVIQAAGVTSPFVVTAQGEVWNSQTGYAYESSADFQAKTGMTLEQATAKKAIQPPPPNMDMLIKQAQLQKAQTDAKYAGAIDQANINQSNASAGASAASAAKSKADLAFENANGGMTPAEANAAGQKVLDDVGSQVQDLANHKTTWGAAFNKISTDYGTANGGQLTNDEIDKMLHAELYRNSQWGG